MLELLAQLAKSADRNHPYFSEWKATELQQRLTDLPQHSSVGDRISLLEQLGQTELQLGNLRSGIEHLNRAYALTPKTDARAVASVSFQLGVAYMRLGETQNCCQRTTPENCILPIRGGGVHQNQAGSRQAIIHFLRVLRIAPAQTYGWLGSRWLLNIAYMTLNEYPDRVPEEHLIPTHVFESEIAFPRFANVASKLGLDTFNLSGGAIIDDFDNDEYLDIFTTTYDTSGQCHLFLNNRDGTFSERTEQAGLAGLVGGLNLVQADYDNDGHLDVLVLRGAWFMAAGHHPNSLLHNNGDGTFSDVTFEAGLGEVHYPTQTAGWADYDNDGDLDLFVGNESSADMTALCQLFRNNGNGTFTDVAEEAGVAYRGYPKGVIWGDYDGDRFPDIYVSEFGGANLLYHNNGDGTFTNVAPQLGVTRPNRSFPVWFWDFDNDGALDLFASSYDGHVGHVAGHYSGIPTQYELASLYRGDGRGGFEDVTKAQGLAYPMQPMGSNFGDLNNDGYLDFYLGTGDPSYASVVPNLMFLNQRGRRFIDVTMAGGFGHLQKGHSVAFADLDNDNDLDVFEQMGGAAKGDEFNDVLYENPGFGNHSLTIKLVGVRSNRSAIGVGIHVRFLEDGEDRSVYRHVCSGGTFGSNPLRQTIGLGKAERIERLEVFWPTTGRTDVFHDIEADQSIRIVEGESGFTTIKLKKLRLRSESADQG